jgi:hypothetical protein
MPIFIPLMCLVGMAVALFQRSAQTAPADPAAREDMPARLLRWAVGLLSPRREEWGQAMLGELHHIDGRDRRWRFCAGCAGAALLLPPWGRAAAAIGALVTVAAGSAVLYGFLGVRYGLGVWDWVFVAISLVLLAGYALVASVLLRQPGVALPGLFGGLLVALMWLMLSGHTFYDVVNLVTSPLGTLVLVIVLPVLVGVAGTLWSGSAAAGRRIARLAGISAGLSISLYGIVAVVALGTGGPPGDPGCTRSCLIADRLATNTIFYLWLLPLTTAALGWSAAAATARIRPRLAATAGSVRVTAAGAVGQRGHRAAYFVLLSAVVAASLIGLAVAFLRG